MKNNSCYDLAIIGAGSVGIAMAYHCRKLGNKDLKVILIDQGPIRKKEKIFCT